MKLLIILALFALSIYLLGFHKRILPYSEQAKRKYGYNIDDDYNEDRANKRNNADRVLEKIKCEGIDSLTLQERLILEEYADKLK